LPPWDRKEGKERRGRREENFAVYTNVPCIDCEIWEEKKEQPPFCFQLYFAESQTKFRPNFAESTSYRKGKRIRIDI
jgi:hypothetical protein